MRAGRSSNIVSINAHCGAPDLAVYSASKAALANMTRNAANAHARDRIRVNGINVGWSLTPTEQALQSGTLGHGPGWLDAANAASPFGRLFAPQEIAALAVFLLSDATGPMTGALVDQEQWLIGANRRPSASPQPPSTACPQACAARATTAECPCRQSPSGRSQARSTPLYRGSGKQPFEPPRSRALHRGQDRTPALDTLKKGEEV